MMKNLKMKYIVTGVLGLTIICLILGVMFNKTEAEKVNGLAENFDVNTNGMIAYVSYDHGKPGIYIRTDEQEKLALELSEEKTLSDITFSPDGRTVAYVVNEDGIASLHTMDARSFDTKKLFQDEAYITDVAYHPKDGTKLFYLRADTFENYSPIAPAKPHEFDVYSYNSSKDKETRHTDLATYDMESLDIAEDGKNVYVTMVDDTEIETEGENFSVGKRIFRIPLDQPEKKAAINMPGEDIYDFVVLPDEAGIIYQAVNKTGDDGVFQYELYLYDATEHETEQLTNVQSHAALPVLADNHETIYFIVNKNFAGTHADNRLYKINIDGTGETQIPLEYE